MNYYTVEKFEIIAVQVDGKLVAKVECYIRMQDGAESVKVEFDLHEATVRTIENELRKRIDKTVLNGN